MRNFSIAFIFVAIVAMIQADGAAAQTVDGVVKANRTSTIHYYAVFHPNTCAALEPPRLKVISVGHGTVRGSIERLEITEGRCKGFNVKGLVIYYTPDRGFRGRDRVRVNLVTVEFVDGQGTRSENMNFNILVE